MEEEIGHLPYLVFLILQNQDKKRAVLPGQPCDSKPFARQNL